MFNINNAIQTLVHAEKVKASRHLTDDEKVALLIALRATVPVISGLDNGAVTVIASINRMIESERKPDARPAQSGKAARVEKPTEVVAGRAEEGPEATSGTTEGVTEPTEDAGRADRQKPRKLKQASAS